MYKEKKRKMTSKSKMKSKRKTKKNSYKKRLRATVRRQRGGNYATDITTRTIEGFPSKPLNKVVVTVPGRGIMSASAYKLLMEDLDRNGDHYYD
jgi:hypothetical protein